MIIAGGTVHTPDGRREVDVHVREGKIEKLEPWSGPTGPDVIDAGGLFNYARQSGMIAAKA